MWRSESGFVAGVSKTLQQPLYFNNLFIYSFTVSINWPGDGGTINQASAAYIPELSAGEKNKNKNKKNPHKSYSILSSAK